MSDKGFHPVVKWSGSKRSQAEQIISLIPDKEYNTYYEPFCGGCSVLYRLIREGSKKFKRFVASDLNHDLIELFTVIRDNPDQLSKKYAELWNDLNDPLNDVNKKRDFFNKIRSEYNSTHDPLLFYFLTRTCMNGMTRYNSKGEFNTSFHLTRNGMNPKTSKEIITEWSAILLANNVEFINQSYADLKPGKDDFVYLDPPYAATKGMYFGGIDQNAFFDWVRKLPCDYAISYDGFVDNGEVKDAIPDDLYNNKVMVKSGNSSFRRLVTGKQTMVSEALYLKI